MKRTLLVLATGMLAFANTYAQNNSSAWPASGPVGIATTAPTHSLTLGSAGTGFAIYNTADQTTNLERLRQYWNSNAFNIATEATGTGVVRNLIIGTQSRKMTIVEGGSALGFFQLNGSTGTANASVASVSGSLSQSTGWSRGFSILNAIYNTGTAGYAALWVSPFESTVGSGPKYLIDAGTNSAGNGLGIHTSKFVVTNDGKIGIGTSTPVSALTLSGVGNSNPNTGPEADYNGENITFQSIATGQTYTTGSIKMTQPTNYYIDRADMVFSVANGGGSLNERMRINAAGYVGIGTSTPKEALSVNGNIRSKEVKIETANWPDYVFKKDYHLLSLSEIEQYIKEHQHLPEMPSAAEVEKNGLNLGETNKLLTKKVEELTLYLIEKDKESKSQAKAYQEVLQRLQDIEGQLKGLVKTK